MANFRFICFADQIAYTPTASSEDTSFPATNLTVLTNLRQRYQALTQGAVVNITLDVGAGNTVSGLAAVPGVFLDWANWASLRIQGNSVTTNWTTPPWNQAVTLTKERWTGRRKGFWKLSELDAAPFAYRYLNLQIQAQSTDDAANYFLSRAPLGSITEWTVNPSFSMQRHIQKPQGRTPLMDGGVQITRLGEPFFVCQLPRILPSAAALNEQLDLSVVALDPFVMWDASLDGSESAWLMQELDNPTELAQQFTTLHEGNMALREIT